MILTSAAYFFLYCQFASKTSCSLGSVYPSSTKNVIACWTELKESRKLLNKL